MLKSSRLQLSINSGLIIFPLGDTIHEFSTVLSAGMTKKYFWLWFETYEECYNIAQIHSVLYFNFFFNQDVKIVSQ